MNRSDKSVAIWLFVCSAMVFLMVVIGGLTRLTGSGLSMVEWEPVLGWIPPLGHDDWMVLFEKYKQTPEFRHVNREYDLLQFQSIFWLEFIHRVLGRLVGVVFLLPFLAFLARGMIRREMAPRLAMIFLLGGLQGAMGWYMVKSGLVDNPHVSQYRLTAHLGLAFIIHAAMFWVALGLLPATARPVQPGPPPRGLAWLVTSVISLTVLSGGFVAGLKAGLAYNTFPLMAGRWFPEDYFLLEPAWHNLFDNVPAVQWDHRLLATVTFFLILFFWNQARGCQLSPLARRGVHLLLAMAVVQVTLGISTLLFYVPVSLASAHQAGAMVLFTIALFINHQFAAARE